MPASVVVFLVSHKAVFLFLSKIHELKIHGGVVLGSVCPVCRGGGWRR